MSTCLNIPERGCAVLVQPVEIANLPGGESRQPDKYKPEGN